MFLLLEGERYDKAQGTGAEKWHRGDKARGEMAREEKVRGKRMGGKVWEKWYGEKGTLEKHCIVPFPRCPFLPY
jgi:hypothetical protein